MVDAEGAAPGGGESGWPVSPVGAGEGPGSSRGRLPSVLGFRFASEAENGGDFRAERGFADQLKRNMRRWLRGRRTAIRPRPAPRARAPGRAGAPSRCAGSRRGDRRASAPIGRGAGRTVQPPSSCGSSRPRPRKGVQPRHLPRRSRRGSTAQHPCRCPSRPRRSAPRRAGRARLGQAELAAAALVDPDTRTVEASGRAGRAAAGRELAQQGRAGSGVGRPAAVPRSCRKVGTP